MFANRGLGWVWRLSSPAGDRRRSRLANFRWSEGLTGTGVHRKSKTAMLKDGMGN